jgi:hypothetical protein
MADRKGLEEAERHREIAELLPWYANGTLAPEERAHVERHLQRCAECRRELEELEGLKAVLTQEAEEVIALAPEQEALLQGTLRQLGLEPESRPRYKQTHVYGWRRLLSLRPAPALALSALAIVFLGLGVILGLQLAIHTPVIGDLPKPGERAAPLTGAYFAIPREILTEGTLTLFVGSQKMAEEAFTLERQDDGTLLLSSNIQAGELAAVQRLVLTAELMPLSYSLQGPLVLGGRRAEARFDLQNRQATLSVCCTRTAEGEQIQRRIVQIEGDPVLYDFSVPSHFALLYRAILKRLRQGISPDELRLTALTPQALRAEPLTIADVNSAVLKAPGQEITVTRYRLLFESQGNVLRVDLYAQDAEGVLLAVKIPVQPRLASSAPVTIYRSDLYPQGFWFEREEGSER